MGIKRFYNTTFIILRYSLETNEYTGQEEKKYTRERTVYQGNLQPVSLLKQSLNNSDTTNVTHRLLCDVIPLSEYDRIEIEGKEYNIKNPIDPANRGHHLELELERIE